MTKVLAQLNIATALAPLDSPHKPLMYFGGLTQITPPTVAQAKEKLEYLRTHGESQVAFSFKQVFPPA